jgi:anti-sigma regulatory factor (Ser/Thr protein kinase)
MKEMIALPVTESSQAAQASRLIGRLAGSLGFNETEAGKVSIVVSEMSSNLVKHAKDGQLLVRPLERNGAAGIEIISLDKGPGMANPARFLRDGYSTTGSMGTGLGAIMRLSSVFDIYSLPGLGTALLARLWAKPLSKERALHPLNTEVGAICLPIPGESMPGDAWAVDERPDRTLVMVVDGLGHGPDAAVPAKAAVGIFRKNPNLLPPALIEATHAALKDTRGAAMAVTLIDTANGTVRFAGVGNITGILLLSPGQSRCMVSHNGIVGHQARKVQEFIYPWPEKALLVMHSDGLGSRWSLDRYPGLMARHPGLIAGVLYRDFRRGNDDVTVVVVRAPSSTGRSSAQ